MPREIDRRKDQVIHPLMGRREGEVNGLYSNREIRNKVDLYEELGIALTLIGGAVLIALIFTI